MITVEDRNGNPIREGDYVELCQETLKSKRYLDYIEGLRDMDIFDDQLENVFQIVKIIGTGTLCEVKISYLNCLILAIMFDPFELIKIK